MEKRLFSYPDINGEPEERFMPHYRPIFSMLAHLMTLT